MEPMYMNMQSYPNQNGQIHYRPRCYSGMEAQPSMSYGYWPWGGSYGYAPPGAYHGCCNHAYIPPHCAWGSPYSHVPPHHCAGNYPHVPVQYMPPPPYSVVEHPRYEYEKNVPVDHHCCGCANRPLHQKEQRNVRIEEEEPERERRKNDSLVPLQFKNSPYPIVWLPPDYKEGDKVQNTEGRKDASRDVKVHENGKTVEQRPPFWNKWLPLDLNNLVSSKQRGDGEENKHQDDGKQNIQFPLYWMPYRPRDMEQENHEMKDVSAKPSLESEKKRQDDGKQNVQFPWYWIPYKPDDTKQENHGVKDVIAKPSSELEKGSGGEQNLHVNSGNIGHQMSSRVKDIPVKEAEQGKGKESSIIRENGRGTSVSDNGEKKNDNVVKVSPTEGFTRNSQSPPKSSKLPPVCLRVDPLPRKKSVNGKSRSPSPPGDKQKLEVKIPPCDKQKLKDEAIEATNVHSSGNEEKVKEGKETKTIAVVDGSTSPEISMNVNLETPEKLPAKSQVVPSTKQEEKPEEEHVPEKHTVKRQSEDIVCAGGENEEVRRAEEAKTDAVKKCRELSEEEAAVIIQSAYRRFAIRRWEPVKKLKQIARVREQIADVKRLIQEMELSSDIHGRAKQKNIIAETIMSLLLKLDTIQGLHPSIREVRKSVVRELVSLQEKLDTVTLENLENSPGQESMMNRDRDDASNKGEDVMSSENGNQINLVDLQNQIDGRSNSESSEFLKANPIEEAAHVKTGMQAVESYEYEDEGVRSAEYPTSKDEDEKSSEVLENNGTTIAEDNEAIMLETGSELSSLQDDSSARATDSTPTDHDLLQSELAELPLGVLDDDLGAAEITKNSAAEADSGKADQLMQLEEASPTVEESHNEIADKENQETTEVNKASDLPLDGVERETKEAETDGSLENYKLDDKFITEQEVDTNIGDARSEPNECTARQLDNSIADMIEQSETSVERELPTAGTYIGNKATYDELHENSGATNSMMEPLVSGTEKEMSRQLPQEGDSNETDLINEHANNCDAVDMVGEERAAEAKSNDETDSSIAKPEVEGAEDATQELEIDSKQDQECNTEEAIKRQGLDDAAEHEENNADPATVQASPDGDDVRASNRKLIEENERMRDMMEKLIKSGHEQLTAIASLSGRVKDLEKRLSRKKKLKVKQYKAPK